MGLSLLDPRNRTGRRTAPAAPAEPPPPAVKPAKVPEVVMPAVKEPAVMDRRQNETAVEYSMLRFFCSLPPAQRKTTIIADHFGVSSQKINAVKSKHDWIDRASALDTWKILQEQDGLAARQMEHRKLESMGAQVLVSEFMRRFKHIPDTQILALWKEFTKTGRLALNMPTVQAEVHHKHTMQLVLRKTIEIAVRYIPPDSLDAFRRDMGDELPTLEGEIVTN